MTGAGMGTYAGVAGIGIDVADIRRFERLVARDAQRLWRHWFTPAETKLCSNSRRPAESTAMRFAVKEATLKAVGSSFSGPVRWRDIEVLGDARRLDVRVAGEIASLARTAGIGTFRASASHAGKWILATVIAETDQPSLGDNI